MSLILSDEQIEKIVNDWVNEDWSVRSIQLDRGHWEYIAPIIAQAQLDHLASMTPEKVREDIDAIIGEHLSEMGCEFTCIKVESKVLDIKDRLTEQICALMQAQIQKIKQDCEIEKQMLQEELCQTVAEAVEKEREDLIKKLQDKLFLIDKITYIEVMGIYLKDWQALKSEVEN